MPKFQQINTSKSTQLLEVFLSTLGSGEESFRYFKKRPLTVIANHLITVLLIDDNQIPVAYGHLEKEGKFTWLGIAVAEKVQGNGFGRIMLQHLLNYAKMQGEEFISLTVDKTNYKAIQLYEHFNFSREAETNSYYQYVYCLK